jgi:hypothetical protein
MYSYATISIGQLSAASSAQGCSFTHSLYEIKASSAYMAAHAAVDWWNGAVNGRVRRGILIFYFYLPAVLSLLLSVQQSNGIFTGAMQPGECRAGHKCVVIFTAARALTLLRDTYLNALLLCVVRACVCVCVWRLPAGPVSTNPSSLDNNNIAVWVCMKYDGMMRSGVLRK